MPTWALYTAGIIVVLAVIVSVLVLVRLARKSSSGAVAGGTSGTPVPSPVPGATTTAPTATATATATAAAATPATTTTPTKKSDALMWVGIAAVSGVVVLGAIWGYPRLSSKPKKGELDPKTLVAKLDSTRRENELLRAENKLVRMSEKIDTITVYKRHSVQVKVSPDYMLTYQRQDSVAFNVTAANGHTYSFPYPLKGAAARTPSSPWLRFEIDREAKADSIRIVIHIWRDPEAARQYAAAS